MSQTEFDRLRIEGGFNEPYEVDFKQRGNPDLHTHPFDALLLVTSGEFTLKAEDGEQQMRTGYMCMIEAGTPHAEVCNAGEATAIVATRPAPA